MEELKRTAIEHHYADLMKSMDPLLVMDNLRAGVLSSAEKDCVKESYSTRRDRNRELISILYRKREELEPLERFVEALKATDASHAIMAEAILETYKHDKSAAEFEGISRISHSNAREAEYGLQIAFRTLIGTVIPKNEISYAELWNDNVKSKNYHRIRLQYHAIAHHWFFTKTDHASHIKYTTVYAQFSFCKERNIGAQQSLKEMYLTRFQKVRPFSLPFTFDIENTWVSLALKEDNKNSQETEDHVKLLKRAFKKAKMLIIEGDPASGKTSLIRRLAYEWARQKEEKKRKSKYMQLRSWVRGKLTAGIQLLNYDLVLYAEFREVREKTFESIAELVLCFSKRYLAIQGYENLKKLIYNEKFCKECRILVLLDGYDESSLEKQCSELSSYINEKMINKALLFNIVVSTRKGYLSTYRDVNGRYVFAEVLGFTTMTQKETYIFKHFHSKEIDNKENIEAVHSLLNNNENLNKLAETPLFLTFICLVHEKIVDGTLLELYCNVIRWLIDRHQQDNPERDVPALFEFQSEQASELLSMKEKQNTIRNNYLQFPQLLCLGKMAMHNLKKDIFQETDFTEFNIKSIIHQVGMIRRDEFYDQLWNLTTTLCFPHRTIQEFLAAFYCFCSNDPTSEWLLRNSKMNTYERNGIYPSGMNEFERFLLRIVLSHTIPIHLEKRKDYFMGISVIELDITFDAFNTTSGFNNELLNWLLSQCINVTYIKLRGIQDNSRHSKNINDAPQNTESTVTSKMSSPILFSFSNLTGLHSLTFNECTFKANSQLTFTNCQSLKNLEFSECTIESSTNLGIASLTAVDTVEFSHCEIDLTIWQSITDAIGYSSVKYLKLAFREHFSNEFLIHLKKCSNVEQMDITILGYRIRQNDLLSFSDLMGLHSLALRHCTLEADSQLSFTNCPSIKNLQFDYCEMKSSTFAGIATLPVLESAEFTVCKIDFATWQSITKQIKDSSVKHLQLSADYFVKKKFPRFLHHLQKCERIEQIHVKDVPDSSLNNDHTLNNYEEVVTVNLAQTVEKLPGLRSIIISDKDGGRLDERIRLEESNKERIEKAGRARNPNFLIKYVE